MTNEELAYLAGFFDGEGSVTINFGYKSPRSVNRNHVLKVSIGNTDPRVLLWIHAEFGGSICLRDPPVGKSHHRKVIQWQLCTAAALPFLEAIRPFVRMKGDQLDIAIAYQKTKSKYRGGKSRVLPGGVVEWRDAQSKAIQELNAKEWIQ